MNVFYDHLVNIHELHLEFDRVDIPVAERNELIKMADSTVHHEVFDLLMVEIPDEHRRFFLESFSTDPGNPQILDFLKRAIPGVEDKIKSRAEAVKNELASQMRSKP